MDFQKAIPVIGLLITTLLLTACDATATADDAAPSADKAKMGQIREAASVGQFEYELRTEQASVLDDRFPFGYWEVTRIYPEVLSEGAPMVANAINQRIAALVDQYRCDGLGDQSFRTQEVYLGNGLLSMAYEAMWMCASMPSPENESGFLNLDLSDGTEVDLEAQFRGPSAYAQFRNLAVRELNDKLDEQVAGTEVTCPEVRTFNQFHTDGEVLTVAALAREQGDPSCDVQVSFPLKSLEGTLRADSILLAGPRHF